MLPAKLSTHSKHREKQSQNISYSKLRYFRCNQITFGKLMRKKIKTQLKVQWCEKRILLDFGQSVIAYLSYSLRRIGWHLSFMYENWLNPFAIAYSDLWIKVRDGFTSDYYHLIPFITRIVKLITFFQRKCLLLVFPKLCQKFYKFNLIGFIWILE